MGRKRTVEKVKVILLVDKELNDKMKEYKVNRSQLMNKAMREKLEELEN